MDGLPNFNLPASESKLIVCGETVFKVKTRPVSKNGYAYMYISNNAHHSSLYREIDNNENQFKHEQVQKDLKVT